MLAPLTVAILASQIHVTVENVTVERTPYVARLAWGWAWEGRLLCAVSGWPGRWCRCGGSP